MRKNNQKSGNLFAGFKIMCTFASLLKGSTLAKEFWRGGRVVDCGGLENRCTARYPGFESLSLRYPVEFILWDFFYVNCLEKVVIFFGDKSCI